MSTPNDRTEPSEMQVALSAVGFFLILFLFAGLLMAFYLRDEPKVVDRGVIAQRTQRLTEVRQRQRALTTSYGWVDREAGIVRIPVQRAMELTLRELSAEGRPLDRLPGEAIAGSLKMGRR